MKIMSMQRICEKLQEADIDVNFIKNTQEKKGGRKMYKFFSKNLSKKRKGFTLIELLVVIAIIAILVAIAAIAFGKVTTKAAISAHNANVRTLQSVSALFLVENKPADLNVAALKTKGFLQEIPEVPKSLSGYTAPGFTYAAQYKVTATAATGEIKVEPAAIKQ